MAHGDPVTSIFLLRIFSMLLGAVTLYYAAKTFAILLPDRALIQKTMVMGIAFLPMFSASSAAINNDNLVFALSAGLIYLSAKNFMEHDTRGSVKMGILLGLLALAKATALPLFLSIFIIEIIKHFRRKSSSSCFLKHLLAIFGVAFLIAGWWYMRNFLLYQMWLPEIGGLAVRQPWLLSAYPNLAKVFPETTGVTALPQASWFTFFVQENFFMEYFQNVWGAFGQFFFRLFSWQYLLVGVIFAASVCGYITVLFSHVRSGKHRKNIGDWQGWTMVLPFMIVLTAITWKLFEIYKVRGFLGAMHGRYLFSAIIPMIYLLIRGVEHLMPQKHLRKALIAMMIFFVINDGVTVLYRIIPEFYGGKTVTFFSAAPWWYGFWDWDIFSFLFPTPSTCNATTVRYPRPILGASRPRFSSALMVIFVMPMRLICCWPPTTATTPIPTIWRFLRTAVVPKILFMLEIFHHPPGATTITTRSIFLSRSVKKQRTSSAFCSPPKTPLRKTASPTGGIVKASRCSK
ncbi:MAG: glycosyltransferase family 39 protein [Candidatus Gracilibacteria bacterium]